MEKDRGNLKMIDKEVLFKKTKRIFLIEFIVISLVLFVIGFLRLFDVIPYSANRLLAYNIITLIGFAYIYFDFFFSLLKKRRRVKTCFLDKTISMIAATYLVIFDILVLAKINTDQTFIKYSVCAVILYAATTSMFLGIYHYFKPTQQVIDVVEEQYDALIKEEQEKQKSENQTKATDDSSNQSSD